MGNHGSSMVTDNTEYALVATRFSVPIGAAYVPLEDYATKFKGVVTGIKMDPQDRHDVDRLADHDAAVQLGPRGDGQGALGGLGVLDLVQHASAPPASSETSSTQQDRDYVAVVNWKAAEAAAKAAGAGTFTASGVRLIDPAEGAGRDVPDPLRQEPARRGRGPERRVHGLLRASCSRTSTVFSFAKIQDAISQQDFTGEEDGIPVIKYEDALLMEVPVGLGPLHTQFDGKGYAYTSLFVESAIAKWKLPPYAEGTDPKALVVDKIPVQFNVGHLVTAHGDTRHPKGDWLVAMNKMSKGRSSGPVRRSRKAPSSSTSRAKARCGWSTRHTPSPSRTSRSWCTRTC